MSGGLEWMPCWRIELSDLCSVRNHRSHQRRLRCTPGNGLKVPWARVQVDVVGPFERHMFLMLVDAHSKWTEVHPVKQVTFLVTIQKPRTIFATDGLPEMLVTDNGSVFTSAYM